MITRETGAYAGRQPDGSNAAENPDRRLQDFYERTESCFREAADSCGGEIVADHRIAGTPVRMQFVGRSLLSAVGRPFEHLRVPAKLLAPELTISLWDTKTSGVTMPAPPWSLNDYTARGEILGYTTPRFRTSYHTYTGILNIADMQSGRAVYWIKDAGTLVGHHTGVPLLAILHWWMASRNLQLMHAGVVGTPDGAALLAGQGGAGKSNTALACVDSGLDYVSDDYCLIQLEPSPRAHSVFCTGRLNPVDLDRLPNFKPLVSNRQNLDSDKALFFLHECFPERLVSELPLRVVLVLRVAQQSRTTWEPAPPAAAHRALTAVTLHTLPGAGQAALRTIARIVKTLPCYFLNLGADRSTVPAAIRAILDTTK